MIALNKRQNRWLAFLLVVLASNYTLYNTGIGLSILPAESKGVVIGSLIDFLIVMPVLFMLYKRKFSVKQAILLAATGCIAARFIIPLEHLQPFVAVTWIGFAIEATIIVLEILLIVSLVRYMPKIIADVKDSALPDLFSFPKAVASHTAKHPIIQMLCSDF